MGSKVAQAVDEPTQVQAGPSSRPAFEHMEEDFPPLPSDNSSMDADINEIVTPTTHVSETQASVAVESDASGTTSHEKAADAHPPRPSGQRAGADKRPAIPKLGSILMSDLNDSNY